MTPFFLIYLFILHCFPEKGSKNKTKNLMSPWITKGLLKSSKRKPKLYEKLFLKKEVTKMRNGIKHIETYLKKLRKTLRNSVIKIS